MDISAALAVQLAALTRSLDEDVDLETELRSLGAQIKTAVASYLGMTVSVLVDGHEISVTVREHSRTAEKITTSIHIPLGAGAGSPDRNRLVIYAATPGAFVDLAADLSYALGLDPTELALDGHLVAPSAALGMTGLDTQSIINQAVGVLIERGHTPDSARDELRRIAGADGGNIGAAADQLLRGRVLRAPMAEEDP